MLVEERAAVVQAAVKAVVAKAEAAVRREDGVEGHLAVKVPFRTHGHVAQAL